MFLKKCGWASSGGSKYHTYVDRIGGKKLPARQASQGDQWTDNIIKHPFPYAFALSMGSNDVADVHRVLIKRRIRDRKKGVTDTDTKWFRWAFKKLTKNAKRSSKFLRACFPKAKPWFIGIIMRPGWPRIVRRLARWMGDYFRSELGYSLIEVDKYIKPHHIKWDEVHLNTHGYIHYYHAVTQGIVTNYMQHMSCVMKRE